MVSGGTGFVGSALIKELQNRGDSVIVLTRPGSESRVPQGAEAVVWTPEKIGPWAKAISGVDAVIHLAGEPVMGALWSDEQKKRIRDSRVLSTRNLVQAMKDAAQKPNVFVCASAVGFYGDRPAGEILDETSAPGTGFLADVVTAWEQSAEPAAELGIRTASIRIGIVLGEKGGALEKMILPFRFFVGGPLGTGQQPVPWIHLRDMVKILMFALDDERVRGPINATAPKPVLMRELSAALGRVMGRPSWLPAPSFALKIAMGEAATAVLTGQWVVPAALEKLGFSFEFRDVEPALRDLLRR